MPGFDITKKNVRVDKLLTNVVVKFRSNNYMASALLPDLTVRKESDKFRIFLPKGFFKGAPIKADGARTAVASPSYSEDTYQTYERAIKDIVTDRAQDNADTPVRPRIDTTNFLMEKVALAEEIDKLDLAITALKAGGSTAVKELTLTGTGTNWRGSGADPLKDFSDAKRQIVRNIGMRPNLNMMDTNSLEALTQISDIKDQIKHTSDRLLTAENPITTIRGMTVTIADAVANTAKEDLAQTFRNVLVDPSAASNKHMTVLFAFVSPGNPLNFGVTFVSRSQRVQRWRGSEGEDREGDFIKVSKIYVPKILSLGAGFMLTQVLDDKDE